MELKQRLFTLLLISGALALAACEPLVPTPTAQTIIVTATPSPAPTRTRTPVPSSTPDVTATPTAEPSPTAALCPETTGRIIPFEDFASEITGQAMNYRVYVPPCYFQSQRRYPVVYLLHGANQTGDQWTDVGITGTLDRGLGLGIYPPMLLVMPDVDDLLDPDGYPPDPSLEDYLVEELIPRIEQDFCVWEDRANRAVGGIDLGGVWALTAAFHNPEVFGAVGGHSPVLGGRIPPDYNPLDLALNEPFLDTLRIYIDNGANDPARPDIQQLSNHLVQRQIPHEYVINPLGDHNTVYWSAHAADYLGFYSGTAADGWPRDVNELPSCLEPSP